jgi:hypothetical protein
MHDVRQDIKGLHQGMSEVVGFVKFLMSERGPAPS